MLLRKPISSQKLMILTFLNLSLTNINASNFILKNNFDLFFKNKDKISVIHMTESFYSYTSFLFFGQKEYLPIKHQISI